VLRAAAESNGGLHLGARAVATGRVRRAETFGSSAVRHGAPRKVAAALGRIAAAVGPRPVPARAASLSVEEKVREVIRSSSSSALPWAVPPRGAVLLARRAVAEGSSALRADAVPHLAREPVAPGRETRVAPAALSVVLPAGWGSAPRIAVALGLAAQRADGRRRPRGAVHRAQRLRDAPAEEILHADDAAGPRLKS